MKKSLLNLVMALGIGLFASCSQEEIISDNENRVETVSVSAQLPGDAVQTRAIPQADANHQLRCILEVWADNKVIQRIEKLGSDATNGKLQFNFTVGSDVDYQCLLWADFIANDATFTDGKYADKYYKTEDLKAIDFVANADLFNNESADAFCGAVAKNGTTNLSVTLKRPFTKVTLKDKGTYLDGVASLAPSFEAPSKFDVSTGKAAGYTPISATGIEPDKTNKTLFSTFIFASTAQSTLDKAITIEFTKTGGGTETKTIKAGQITLDQNVKNDVTADYAADGTDVTVDVDIDDQYPDPNALKIGQFINKDGNVVDTYEKDKAIGIIFAVGAQGDDEAANYGTSFEGKAIAGYAMALESTAIKAPMPPSTTDDKTAVDMPAAGLIDTDLTNFSGIKNTDAILSALQTASITSALFNTEFDTWKSDHAFTGNNLSGWYIPSFQQLVTFIGYYYDTSSNTGTATFPDQNTDFKTAVDAAGANQFVKSNKNLLSSSFKTATTIAGVQLNITTTEPASNVFVKDLAPNAKNTAYMRPVLTVFKAE